MNAQTVHFGVDNGDSLPGGVTPGSLATWQDESNFYLSKADGSKQFAAPFSIPKSLTGFSGLTESATVPTTTDLPDDGNFGWHLNTATGEYSQAYNDGGVIVFQSLSTLTGSISDLSGSITEAQHGNLATGTLHPFTVISGSINDAQHGNRGNNSGSAHDVVITSAGGAGVHGFMHRDDKAKIDRYPLDCTTVYNDSNAVQRSAGNISGTKFSVNGVQIITSQGAAINDAPTAPADLDVLTTKFNQLLARLRAHGLIAT